jgi:hypothetical protein
MLRGGRAITGGLAYSVTRLTDVSNDDLLTGALLSPRTYPHCVVMKHPREAVLNET